MLARYTYDAAMNNKINLMVTVHVIMALKTDNYTIAELSKQAKSVAIGCNNAN